MTQHLLRERLEILRTMPFLVNGADGLPTDLRLVDSLALADHGFQD